MAATASVDKALPQLPVRPAPAIRRFEIPDLARHGGWLMKRLIATYPYLSDRELQGWLRGLIYNPECLFLYQDNSVALAQVVLNYTLTPKPVIYERFVFAEDKANSAHVEQAAEFYAEFERWAKNKSVDTILVEELTDVPHDLIKKHLGRLFTRQQTFARV